MKSFVIFFLLSFLTVIEAKEHQHHHSVGKHEHGAVKLEMAAEGKILELDMDGPAEAFLGFEHMPKTSKEKQKFQVAETLWTKYLLSKLLFISEGSGCLLGQATFEQVVDETETKTSKKESGVHSNIEAKAKIVCQKDVLGLGVSVAIRKHYPSIKKLTIDIVGSTTKTVNAKVIEQIKL